MTSCFLCVFVDPRLEIVRILVRAGEIVKRFELSILQASTTVTASTIILKAGREPWGWMFLKLPFHTFHESWVDDPNAKRPNESFVSVLLRRALIASRGAERVTESSLLVAQVPANDVACTSTIILLELASTENLTASKLYEPFYLWTFFWKGFIIMNLFMNLSFFIVLLYKRQIFMNRFFFKGFINENRFINRFIITWRLVT